MRAGCRLVLLVLLAEAAPVAGGGGGGGEAGGPVPGAVPGAATAAPRGPGEPCGVYTPGCARGLRCIPRPGERAPLRALLRGTGLCRPLRARPAGTGAPAGESPQEGSPATPPPRPPPADGKEELETAPCRGHLAAVLQELRAGLYRTAAAIFLPNCDTRGFYRPKQCRASQGLKRGQCWCVDRRGHPLAGTEGQGGAPRCPPPEGARGWDPEIQRDVGKGAPAVSVSRGGDPKSGLSSLTSLPHFPGARTLPACPSFAPSLPPPSPKPRPSPPQATPHLSATPPPRAEPNHAPSP
ncbi:insulin-like growth factor-binding protein 6 [Morphnus guianensis]